MNSMRMPGFVAEISLSNRGAHYRGSATPASLSEEGEVLVHPAMKFFCGTEKCCLSRIPGLPGFGAICCPISGEGDCEFVFT
jgi:hypothetical protein